MLHWASSKGHKEMRDGRSDVFLQTSWPIFSQDLAMYLISLNANPNDLDSKAGFFFMVLPGQPKV